MAIPGYRILRKIRQGGMSTVYLAIQKSVEREVAIKVMSPSLSSDPSFGSRFYREAKIVGQLSHPNIVSIYDVGSYKHYNYIAMDYLPGAPLQDKLDEGVSASDAIRIVREMASALDYAHERGYIHRDIKPDNILFREDGAAVLCDFGIAKALKGNIKMTNIGSVLGTPHYMSPEQAQGKELDGRADIYSLGVVFYEMLSGQVPFTGDDAVAVAVKHMSSPIPKLPASHKAFQPIIEKMMAKKTSERFQNGKEIIAALEELESTISKTGPAHLTQTGSTTVQVIGLMGALLGTLTNAISLSFKRLMLTKITFASNTVQLTNKQLEDIDTFILAEDSGEEGEYDDLAIIQDTIEQPAIRYNYRWLLWPLAVLAIAASALMYLNSAPTQPGPMVGQPVVAAPAAITVPEPVSEVPPADVNEQEPLADAAVTEPEPEPPPAPIKKYTFTIITEPPDATVRILNIKPKYTEGMLLPAGAYHVAVSAEDYFPTRKWLKIKSRDVTRTIRLEPTRRVLAPGSEIIDQLSDGSNGPTMIVVPSEGIEKPIAVAATEVSFADYEKFAVANNLPVPDDFGWGKVNRPVVSVSYNDATAYARWLSQETGQLYRLPTRQEWEHAARAGTSGTYWWGEGSPSEKANCRRGCKSDFSKLFGSTTAPVASYAPNPFGLFDTAGNVEEWLGECSSWQDQEQTTCQSAKVAGGSHADKDKGIHSGAVKSANATEGSKTIGFRVVLEL